MILEALRTGYMEGNGPYYKQVRAEIRPRPERSFKDACMGSRCRRIPRRWSASWAAG